MRITIKIVLAVIAFLNGLLFLNFPASVGDIGLDDSWRQSLAMLLKSGAQAGTEWIYSYGPFGHFGTVLYDSDLFYAGFIWELLTKSIFIVCLFKLIHPVSRPLTKMFLLTLVALFLPWVHPEAHTLMLLTSVGLLFTSRMEPPSKWFVFLVTLLFAAFSHVKFVYFMFCAIVILISEYQYRRRNWRTFLSPLPLYLLFFLLFWILARQSISNLPDYVAGSVQTANGYVEAMAYPGERSELFVAILICILLAVVTVIRFAGTSGFAPMLVCLAGLFLSWKHGFVRQLTHTVLFFSFTFFLSLILLADFQKGKERLTRSILLPVLLGVCLILSGAGIVQSHWAEFMNDGATVGPGALMRLCSVRLKRNAVSLLNPARLKISSEKKKAYFQQKRLIPHIKSEVGRRTIDIVSYEQGTIFLNELNWRPRPVFQSFHTFTPYLAAANANFYESERAPEFVLYKLQSIDDRFPTLDDNQAIFSLLKWYTPQTAEKSYLLLKRSEGVKRADGQRIMRHRRIRFGEEVRIDDISGRFQKLQLNVEDSIAGKIRRFLFRPPVLTIRVNTSARSEILYRFIPCMGRRGVLINPLLLSTGDFVRLYGLRDRARVVSFSILPVRNYDLWFREEIDMELHSIARPASILIRDDSRVEQLASAVDAR